MTLRKTLSSLLVLFTAALPLPLQQPVRGEDRHELDFVGHLFRRGEYQAASLELHRFLYHRPDHPSTPYARYLLALCRANLGDLGKAEADLRSLAGELEGGGEPAGLRGEVLVQTMNVQLRGGRFDDLLLLGEALDAGGVDLEPGLARYADALILAALVYVNRWEQARGFVRSARCLDERVRARVDAEIRGLLTGRDKRPLAAGLLSVVPGLGHLYAGRLSDGVRSLAVNAAFTGLWAAAFLHGAAPLAVLFGVAEAFLFAASLYGGINAVLQENASRVLDARDRILRLLPVPPLDVITLREEPAGL